MAVAGAVPLKRSAVGVGGERRGRETAGVAHAARRGGRARRRRLARRALVRARHVQVERRVRRRASNAHAHRAQAGARTRTRSFRRTDSRAGRGRVRQARDVYRVAATTARHREARWRRSLLARQAPRQTAEREAARLLVRGQANADLLAAQLETLDFVPASQCTQTRHFNTWLHPLRDTNQQ